MKAFSSEVARAKICSRAGAAILAAAVFLFLLSFPSIASATGAEDSGIISRGSAVQGGPPPQLAVLFTGEVMGWTEPCG